MEGAPSIRRRAPAKANLFLELRGLRPDGYHEIDTVMVPLSLADELHFRLNPTGAVRLAWQRGPGFSQDVPQGRDNLVIRAIDRLREVAGEPRGIDVGLVKRIPTQAGLGGASADAAAALWGACRVWGIDWNVQQLAALAAAIGSDVPFCVVGVPARCLGRGEQVMPIRAAGGIPLVLVQPPLGLATPSVYRRADDLNQAAGTRTCDELLRGLSESRYNQIAASLFNRLESAATSLSDGVQRLLSALRNEAATAVLMTGSGSCCLGLFGSRRSAQQAAARLAGKLPDHRVWTCGTLGSA